MTTSTIKPGMGAALASPYTPIAVINGTPIYAIQGGRSGGGIQIVAGDADGDDDDALLGDDEEGDEDDDDDDEPEEEDEDPRARRRKPADRDPDESMVRMEAALRKANNTAAKYRRAGKTMERLGIEDFQTWLTERGINPETGLPFGDDVVDPDGVDEEDDSLFDDRASRRDTAKRDRETTRQIRAAEKRAEARAMEKLVPILAQTAATNALREAGFTGTPAKMERLLRMIDPAELDVVVDDDSFEIDGLDEAIAALRDDFPELFADADDERPSRRRSTAAKRTPARRMSGARDVDGGDRGRPKPKPGGWMEQLVQQMDKRGR